MEMRTVLTACLTLQLVQLGLGVPVDSSVCNVFNCDCNSGQIEEEWTDEVGCYVCRCVPKQECGRRSGFCVCPPGGGTPSPFYDDRNCRDCICSIVGGCPGYPCACNLGEKKVFSLEDGCPTCRCVSVCPEMDCNSDLQSIKETWINEDGCRTCRCVDKPVCTADPTCVCSPGQTPDLHYNDNTCRQCDCVAGPGCPEPNCHCSVRNNLQTSTDDDGCPTCRCVLKPVCSDSACGECAPGQTRSISYGDRKCSSCSCSAITITSCPEVICDCPAGQRVEFPPLDETQCPTCHCAPDPGECEESICKCFPSEKELLVKDEKNNNCLICTCVVFPVIQVL